MAKRNKSLVLIPILILLFITACSVFGRSLSPVAPPANDKSLEGPANAANGERIYFYADSARGTAITYRGGPNFGGMMMGSYLTCAACHGPEARGGKHVMHMQVMDAPNITYEALSSESAEHDGADGHSDEHEGYSIDDFQLAVVEGKHPDGKTLSNDMPRWQMGDEDLSDLFAFLKSLSNE